MTETAFLTIDTPFRDMLYRAQVAGAKARRMRLERCPVRFMIAEVATAQGYTIETLATHTGLNYTTIYRLWHNKAMDVPLKEFGLLMKTLHVDATALLTPVA